MPSPFNVVLTRKFRRHRYISGAGWVVSQTTFRGRTQVKKSDSITRLVSPEGLDPFGSITLYRENKHRMDTVIDASFSFSSPAEAAAAAQTGSELIIGDRVRDEESGYLVIVRGLSPYRDGHLQHDEIICSEASHLDVKWIEPIDIGGVAETVGNPHYDPIRRQFTRITKSDLNIVNSFGVIVPADTARYTRDSLLIDRTDAGKTFDDKLIVFMDADFPVDGNKTLHFRGKDWKVEYTRESLTRVMLIGVSPLKARGLTGDTPPEEPNRIISRS